MQQAWWVFQGLDRRRAALADRFSDIWTNFARSANPNGPGIPVWPRYDSKSEQIMVLDDTLHVTSHYRSAEQDFAYASYLYSGPWVPVFPFPENGPCTDRFYCQTWLHDGFEVFVGAEPPSPYAPSWTIFKWGPTKAMIDGAAIVPGYGPNPWEAH